MLAAQQRETQGKRNSRFEVAGWNLWITGQERTFGLGRNNWNYGQSASFEGPINQGWKHEHPAARAIGSTHAIQRERERERELLDSIRLDSIRLGQYRLTKCWNGRIGKSRGTLFGKIRFYHAIPPAYVSLLQLFRKRMAFHLP